MSLQGRCWCVCVHAVSNKKLFEMELLLKHYPGVCHCKNLNSVDHLSLHSIRFDNQETSARPWWLLRLFRGQHWHWPENGWKHRWLSPSDRSGLYCYYLNTVWWNFPVKNIEIFEILFHSSNVFSSSPFSCNVSREWHIFVEAPVSFWHGNCILPNVLLVFFTQQKLRKEISKHFPKDCDSFFRLSLLQVFTVKWKCLFCSFSFYTAPAIRTIKNKRRDMQRGVFWPILGFRRRHQCDSCSWDSVQRRK